MMQATSKPRIIRDYTKLSDELWEQLKLVYPKGYEQHLIPFTGIDGLKKLGLPLETDDHIYLVKMTRTVAEQLIDEDDDFNDDGELRRRIKVEYEDKYEDLTYLEDYNSNEDNDLGEEEQNYEEDYFG